MVEGVHFLAGENPGVIARRLLRTSLSDLAAKAAEPFGYFLMVAWPEHCDKTWRDAFAEGLAADGEAFALALLGGDTVATPGPLTLSATVLGWAPAGRTVLRSGARAGDRLIVCGAIGEGWLGLAAVRGAVADPDGRLARHYRLPQPLLSLRSALIEHAHAAADVSDGLLSDAGHIATASGLGVAIDLAALPISADALAWLAGQPDSTAARLALACGGDDYALACAVSPARRDSFMSAVAALGVAAVRDVGEFEASAGVRATFAGLPVEFSTVGWRH
jgi:thiamine-monophosphate kinase